VRYSNNGLVIVLLCSSFWTLVFRFSKTIREDLDQISSSFQAATRLGHVVDTKADAFLIFYTRIGTLATALQDIGFKTHSKLSHDGHTAQTDPPALRFAEQSTTMLYTFCFIHY
jgi:hypothetical protein